MVVYRGFPKSKKLGNTFKKSVRMFPTKGVSGRETNKFAFYFSDNKTVAERYGENIAGKDGEYIVKEYFLNIKSLFKAYTQKNQDEISFYDMYDLATKDRKPLLVKDWEGNEVKFIEQYPEFEKAYNFRHFLGGSRDVMPTFYYFVDWSKKDNNQNFWREYLKEKLKYDGIVFYERTYNASYNKEKDETIPEFGDELSKTYGAFEPNQIKLADGTNTTFDPNSDDIRFENGGYIEDYGDYKIEVENDFEYIVTALKNGKRVGLLTFLRHPYTSKNGELYILVDIIDINKKERGYGLATKMYQYALKHLPKKYKGIASDLKSRINKNEIPKIYSKFNNKIESSGGVEYHLITNDNIRFATGGTVLLAPNGKPSNLTTEQYKLVRTPEFKAWFGDWENDPKNASKVVDENGEPLVVYHGTKYTQEFNEFDLDAISDENVKAFFFSKGYEHAKRYTFSTGSVKPFFLKAIKLFDPKSISKVESTKIRSILEESVVKDFIEYNYLDGLEEWKIKYDSNMSDKDLLFYILTKTDSSWQVVELQVIQDYLKSNNYNGFITYEQVTNQSIPNVNYAVFEPNQIKLADGTNTTFDPNSDDIRFATGGTIDLASFNKKSKSELKKEGYQHIESKYDKRKVLTFLYAMEYYAKNNIIPLAEPDNEGSIYWQRISLNDKEYNISFNLYFHDFDNPLKITKAEVTFYDEDYNELDSSDIQFKDGGNLPNKNYLTLYHGTILKNLPKIQENGLVSNLGYSAGWYMLSSDFESALYHGTALNEGEQVPVIEFHIPIIETDRWEGYPYVWTEEKRNDKSSWYAPMKEIPKEFIHKVHYVSYEDWLKQKTDKYENGGRTVAQTPAPSKERIYGSDRNKPRSSKDSSSAESIKFDNKTLTSIENKVEKHNEEHPDKKVNLATAKAVVRRGMGAYSKSHRPTISGGQPNSRVAWGLARLNAFLYKVVHGVSKSGKYSQDNDLLDELGIAHKKFADGGKLPKKNTGGDCYVVAGRIALNNRFPDGENPKFVGEPYVIHAQVTGQGAIAGLKYGHAWVEDDDFVYEYSNGRDLKVPKKLYYKISQVIKKQPIYFKYTFGEAKRKMAESGHFGSWDLITESGL